LANLSLQKGQHCRESDGSAECPETALPERSAMQRHTPAPGRRNFLAAALGLIATPVEALAQTLQFRPHAVPGHHGGEADGVPLPKAARGRQREFAASAAGDQGSVVFVGDSITQGWGRIEASIPGIRAANRGINGDTTLGVAARLDRDVLSLRPRAVVLLIGTNDLAGGAAPATVIATIRSIMGRLRASNAAMPIFLCRIPPRRYEAGVTQTKITEVNTGLRRLSSGMRGVTLVDTWTLFQGPPGQPDLALLPDGLHPGPQGYARWASVMQRHFRARGLIARSSAKAAMALPAGVEPAFAT
jgi:lysophospholipase L1-like esterase